MLTHEQGGDDMKQNTFRDPEERPPDGIYVQVTGRDDEHNAEVLAEVAKILKSVFSDTEEEN